jgi:threonine dehydrogenase-like Zn-dependent dehydrogenase
MTLGTYCRPVSAHTLCAEVLLICNKKTLTLLQATKSGGVAVIVGMGAPEVKIPLVNALAREVDIRGIFRYANE